MATCPECDFDEVDTEDLEEGDTVSCPECGKSLIVSGADEVELADDDLDDEDDEEEEEEEEEDDEDDLDDDEEEVEEDVD
jgi:hypothetical protein